MSGRKGRLPQKPCAECGVDIDARVKSGLCKVCVRKPCLDCGTILGPKNTSGRCPSCLLKHSNTQPEFQEKRLEALSRKWQDPEFAEAARKRAQRLGQKYSIDPELQARRVAWGKFAYANWLGTPEVMAKALSSPKRGVSVSEARMAWCPPEMRDRYRFLMRSKKMKHADAREMIEREWADKKALRHVESALEYLRRFTPVKVEEHGYRVGFSDLLRPSEVVRRAELRGWEPERRAA